MESFASFLNCRSAVIKASRIRPHLKVLCRSLLALSNQGCGTRQEIADLLHKERRYEKDADISGASPKVRLQILRHFQRSFARLILKFLITISTEERKIVNAGVMPS